MTRAAPLSKLLWKTVPTKRLRNCNSRRANFNVQISQIKLKLHHTFFALSVFNWTVSKYPETENATHEYKAGHIYGGWLFLIFFDKCLITSIMFAMVRNKSHSNFLVLHTNFKKNYMSNMQGFLGKSEMRQKKNVNWLWHPYKNIVKRKNSKGNHLSR